MKKYAIYLPQFHEIKENNEWWGEGFTEWTNVRNAKPLFKGHEQPKHPLNDNYYNLLDKNVMKWQTTLARENGIDGFVYYHYYFNGKLLMEKPMENLLRWNDIDQSYFFCWANHSWLKGSGKKREVLIKQEYGGEADWEKHFNYLLKFFKDERYEKINNCPVLMIYVSCFKEKEAMLAYFDKRCKDEGFFGIYIIETYTGTFSQNELNNFIEDLTSYSKMIYCREPNVSTGLYYKKHFIRRLMQKLLRQYLDKFPESWVTKINGNDLFEIMIKKDYSIFFDEKIVHGLFFEWDNTPRHKQKGYIITPPSHELFVKYVNKVKDDDFVFINAWNEWAEGMMLEPSEETGMKYLEWIKQVNC